MDVVPTYKRNVADIDLGFRVPLFTRPQTHAHSWRTMLAVPVELARPSETVALDLSLSVWLINGQTRLSDWD